MKRVVITIGVIAVLAIGFFVWMNKDRDAITIGAILSLTGDAAAWGIPPRNGAILAVEQINKTGGIHGKKLKLVIEDGACDPRVGVSAINKLIASNKPIAIIGGVCSGVTLAIAPIAQSNQIVLISPASTHTSITDLGDFVFRVIPSEALRSQIFADYIASLGHITAMVLAINNDSGKGIELNFKNFFAKNGGEVIGSEFYSPDATSVRTQLTKIRQMKPDIILAISQVTDAVIVLREAVELNIDIPLFFLTEALDDPSVIRNAGNAANGATYITFAIDDSKKNQEFQTAYTKRFNKAPNLFAPEAYDAVMIIAQQLSVLMEENKDISAINLERSLYNVSDFDGASGLISFDKNGDVIKPLDIKIIENLVPIIVK